MNEDGRTWPRRPHALVAEQRLLGALLSGKASFGSVADVLRRDMFTDPLHGAILSRIRDRERAGWTATTLTAEVVDGGHSHLEQLLADAGGTAYLRQLEALPHDVLADAPHPASVHSLALAHVIRDAWARRQTITAAELTITSAEHAINTASGGPGTEGNELFRGISGLQALRAALRTGLEELDRALGGLTVDTTDELGLEFYDDVARDAAP